MGYRFSMVKYQYEQQVEAYNDVIDVISQENFTGTIFEQLMEDALIEWNTDFNMFYINMSNNLKHMKM